MRLSDLQGSGASRDEHSTLQEEPFEASSLAEPPITIEEVREARQRGDHETVCRCHKGQFTHLNTDGAVYFCTIGRQWWRYSRQLSGMYAPLRYKGGL